MGQAALIKSIEQQSTQLAARLHVANIEGEKQYLEQHVLELEAKHNEKIERLESNVRSSVEKEVLVVTGQLSSIEGDNQYLQQNQRQRLASLMRKSEK